MEAEQKAPRTNGVTERAVDGGIPSHRMWRATTGNGLSEPFLGPRLDSPRTAVMAD